MGVHGIGNSSAKLELDAGTGSIGRHQGDVLMCALALKRCDIYRDLPSSFYHPSHHIETFYTSHICSHPLLLPQGTADMESISR